jgi:hypothetical protein
VNDLISFSKNVGFGAPIAQYVYVVAMDSLSDPGLSLGPTSRQNLTGEMGAASRVPVFHGDFITCTEADSGLAG